MYQETFKFDLLPKTLNQMIAAHPFVRKKYRDMWDKMVLAAVMGRRPGKPLEKFHLTLVRHGSTDLDYDGLVGSFKYVVDSFVSVGVLAGDEYKRTGPWSVSQVKVPRRSGFITVTIQEETRVKDPKKSSSKPDISLPVRETVLLPSALPSPFWQSPRQSRSASDHAQHGFPWQP